MVFFSRSYVALCHTLKGEKKKFKTRAPLATLWVQHTATHLYIYIYVYIATHCTNLDLCSVLQSVAVCCTHKIAGTFCDRNTVFLASQMVFLETLMSHGQVTSHEPCRRTPSSDGVSRNIDESYHSAPWVIEKSRRKSHWWVMPQNTFRRWCF